MDATVRITQAERRENEKAFNTAMRMLLASVGIVRAKAIGSEVIVMFRKHTPSNAGNTEDAERALAFGPDLLVRAHRCECENIEP